MLRLVLISLFIGLCFFCCKEKSSIKSSENLNDSSTTCSLGEVCDVNPLDGYWISERYKKGLTDNLSPFLCSKKIGDVSEVWINEKSAHVVYGNAEGDSYEYVKSKEEESFEIELSNQMKITYQGDNRALITGNKIDEYLSKCEEPFEGRSALEQFVISHLFVGSYESLEGNVSLNEDGTLMGLANYLSYKVFTSFEELSDFDLIELRDLNGKADYKAWEIQGDILILFNIVPGDSYVFAKGKEWKRLKLKEAIS
ncbi:MAG: hypothetical protein JXQ87_00165 [Bacteroidia bacterium]